MAEGEIICNLVNLRKSSPQREHPCNIVLQYFFIRILVQKAVFLPHADDGDLSAGQLLVF